MKTIKVIDLLNKIANGEEVPKRVLKEDRFGNKEEYNYDNFWYIHTYMTSEGEKDYYLMPRDINDLNDEVEIIEDTPKEDKKIEHLKLYPPFPECTDDRFEDLENKINEIIDKINGEK